MDHVAPPPLRTRAARLLEPLVGIALLASTLAAATTASTAMAATAAAQAASDPVAAADAQVTDLRAQADALADRYFASLGRVAQIEQRADEIEAELPALRAEAARLRDVTRDRAVEAYKRSGRDLGAVVGARDPLDAARRIRWLQRLNQRDNHAVERLQDATAKLDAQRAELRAAHDEADRALTDVKSQGDQINALLADAEQQRQAALLAALAPPAAVEANPSGTGSGTTGPAATSPSPTTTTTAPPKTPPPAPPTYVPTPGAHPRHDEPFLVCTRTRESGGNYAAYNPAGPYLGAYQFLQATWNSAANHAGRPELINVPPSTASQYDQDDMAWTLYQWQGSRPWGGLCDDAI
jgi:peptidoglycan hydrolase CwlO-like protein